MKPTVERYRAATKVNALSPEIDDFEKADSLQELEGSTVHGVMASLNCFSGISGRGMVSNGLRRNLGEPLCSSPTGTFRVCADKQPGLLPVRYPTWNGAKNKGYRRVRREQVEKARNR